MFIVLLLVALFNFGSFGALSSSSKTDTSKDRHVKLVTCLLHAFLKKNRFINILVNEWVMYNLAESAGLVFV